MKRKKVILAFSGGLDTSFCALWLKKHGFEVVAMTVDTGGFTEKEKEFVKAQASRLKVSRHYFLDGKTDLYDKFISYIIKGNLLRGGIYPICVGPERLVIAAKLVLIAENEKTEFVAHGSTGAGSDQVRLDTAIRVLASKLKVLAPIRKLSITRKKEQAFLFKHNIPLPHHSSNYSINRGLIGTTIGGKETNSSWEFPPDSVYASVIHIDEASEKGTEIIISFEKGLPKAIKQIKDTSRVSCDNAPDSPEMEEPGVKIMKCLNSLGAKHGVGKNIHLGDTIIGIKGRIAFEAPAAFILIKAHHELEKLVLTKWQLFWKDIVAKVYGDFLHEAKYFDPVMRDIEAFIDSSQQRVKGEVRVKLCKGNIIIKGCKSPYSLMNQKVAIYGEENTFWSGIEAAGFCKIYGLQSLLASKAKNEVRPRFGGRDL